MSEWQTLEKTRKPKEKRSEDNSNKGGDVIVSTFSDGYDILAFQKQLEMEDKAEEDKKLEEERRKQEEEREEKGQKKSCEGEKSWTNKENNSWRERQSLRNPRRKAQKVIVLNRFGVL